MPEGFREIDDPRIEGAVIESAKARKAAYAPYSRFKMGSAVVTDTGTIIRGALVENVSLGLAMCAERVALFASVAQELGRPEILVVNSKRTSGKLTWPCGACLQVARELGGPDLIVVATDGQETQSARLSDLAQLLPAKDQR